MKSIKVITTPLHFSNYDTIGLRAACLRAGITVFKGGDTKKGLEKIRALLSHTNHGEPSIIVSPSASWTLRAFVGGYARQIDKTGFLKEEPAPGPYSTLMHGLQSLLAFSGAEEVDTDKVYGVTSGGHRYVTARR